MKPWRVVLAVLVFGGATAGLFAGPVLLRYVLFWTFFFAVPGPVALRILGVRQGWAFIIAGAVSGSLGLIGAAYPIPPNFTGVCVPAFIGAVFGLGWKFLLWLKDEQRGEISPIQRTVNWWG
jgi:hypothetical protein